MAADTTFETSSAVWPGEITIVDVTARDGLQDAGTLLLTEQKRSFIDALIAAGISHIEVTSFMRPEWIPQLADADILAASLRQVPGITYSALIPNMRGYERARAANIAEVVLVVSASEAHNRANLNRSRADSLHQLAQVAAQAKADGKQVRGAIATAFGCPFEDTVAPEAVLDIVEAYAKMGVDQISLADTIGVGNPRQVYTLFTRARTLLPAHFPLAAHFHDRNGYALANVFAALQAGVTSFDAAVGGLGGCPYAPGAPGNLSLEALVEYVEAMGFQTNLSRTALATARQDLLNNLARGEPVTSKHSMR